MSRHPSYDVPLQINDLEEPPQEEEPSKKNSTDDLKTEFYDLESFVLMVGLDDVRIAVEYALLMLRAKFLGSVWF